MVGALVSLLVAVGAVVAVVVPGLVGTSDARAAMTNAGCSFRTYPATTSEHVPETASVDYNSFPPTNGAMTEETVVWGYYTEPVSEKALVHNLEHGGVAVQFGREVGPSTVARLWEFYRSDSNGLVVARLAALGDKIALAAWNAREPSKSRSGKPDLGEGVLAVCPRFDAKAFGTFVDKHRYKGPERPPRETLEPGLGH